MLPPGNGDFSRRRRARELTGRIRLKKAILIVGFEIEPVPDLCLPIPCTVRLEQRAVGLPTKDTTNLPRFEFLRVLRRAAQWS